MRDSICGVEYELYSDDHDKDFYKEVKLYKTQIGNLFTVSITEYIEEYKKGDESHLFGWRIDDYTDEAVLDDCTRLYKTVEECEKDMMLSLIMKAEKYEKAKRFF